MKASGESSTTKHRILHASGPHPIPPPNDSKFVLVGIFRRAFEELVSSRFEQAVGAVFCVICRGGGRLRLIRSTTGSKVPSSACTIRPDEISTDGFSSSSRPEQIPATQGGDGGGTRRRRRLV
ncbi:hypothetical protein F511_41799 [Dorcoceras hygrometricum]|uniref:Uncharacterized protein n=1 Tax=Dorcoceras hygrometricum TaxID=472368 RepID=A0A2Z7A5B7_9LAMI|nr:hypothetical protein F511_41799 [Dorcoceras hygrometricum]